MPLEIVVWWVAPGLLFWLACHAPAGLSRLRVEVTRRRAGDPPPVPSPKPVELLAADLRRLSAELDRVQACPDLPGRVTRLRAFSQAYDDTLVRACAVLGAPPPAHPPLSDLERLEAEAVLAQRGLQW